MPRRPTTPRPFDRALIRETVLRTVGAELDRRLKRDPGHNHLELALRILLGPDDGDGQPGPLLPGPGSLTADGTAASACWFTSRRRNSPASRDASR